jgi:hypothetical protein
MNRTQLALAGVLVVLAGQSAHAQVNVYRPPINNPILSPYLLLRSGGNPAINYFGIVQPLENLNTFQQQQLQLNNQLANLVNNPNNPLVRGALPQTGTSQRFMAYQGYFMTVGGGRAGPVAPPPGYNAPIPWNSGGTR